MKKTASFLFLFFIGALQAQQLNCTVQVNTEKLASTNSQVFKTLQNAISDFVNKTDFTGETLKQNEKVSCSMIINLNSYDSNQYSATIQVQSSRPVFNSTYSTPVFNYYDKDFNFSYVEFENLNFDPASFNSNLVSVLSYYSYMILGFDSDTYALKGGTNWFNVAQQILTVAQQGGYKGWSQSDSTQNRYFLVNDVLSGTFDAFREASYEYHREGLDMMNQDLKLAKTKILESVNALNAIYKIRPNAFLTRIFFDAKADEIVSILSGGPSVPIADTVDTLNKLSPINSSKWASIKL
ncbi:DUF4835 family protein [Flavobacterium sp. XGLA_31]|uniref:type IX secretion system protein PorD n=1 Tax=Flavobacterium sp. XGLA_31 TaxID=3447666 RepID=UPI003F37D45E